VARAWTESYILSQIRALLRKLSMRMPSIRQIKLESRRAYKGPHRLLKFEYECNHCHEWFPEKCVQVDHLVPAGSMKTFHDVGPFAQRLLFPAHGHLQVLCLPCHNTKTQAEKSARKII